MGINWLLLFLFIPAFGEQRNNFFINQENQNAVLNSNAAFSFEHENFSCTTSYGVNQSGYYHNKPINFLESDQLGFWHNRKFSHYADIEFEHFFEQNYFKKFPKKLHKSIRYKILNLWKLYKFPEFINYIKKFPEFAGFIASIHKEIQQNPHSTNSLLLSYFPGYNTGGLTTIITRLAQEQTTDFNNKVQRNKLHQLSTAQVTNNFTSDPAYKTFKAEINNNPQKSASFLKLNQKLLEKSAQYYFSQKPTSYNGQGFSPDAAKLLAFTKNMPGTTYSFYAFSPYQHYLHEQCIKTINRAGEIYKKYTMFPLVTEYMRSASFFGQAAMASNKLGNLTQSRKLLHVCSTLIEYGEALGEYGLAIKNGIAQGLFNVVETVHSLHDLVYLGFQGCLYIHENKDILVKKLTDTLLNPQETLQKIKRAAHVVKQKLHPAAQALGELIATYVPPDYDTLAHMPDGEMLYLQTLEERYKNWDQACSVTSRKIQNIKATQVLETSFQVATELLITNKILNSLSVLGKAVAAEIKSFTAGENLLTQLKVLNIKPISPGFLLLKDAGAFEELFILGSQLNLEKEVIAKALRNIELPAIGGNIKEFTKAAKELLGKPNFNEVFTCAIKCAADETQTEQARATVYELTRVAHHLKKGEKMGISAIETLHVPTHRVCNTLCVEKRHLIDVEEIKAIFKGIYQILKKKFTDILFEIEGKIIKVSIDFKHIFEPEIRCLRTDFKLSGFHHDYLGQIEELGIIQFTDIINGPNGVYSAKWWYKGIDKRSTFFPKNWSREKVCEVILEACEQPRLIKKADSGNITLRGLTKEEITIEFVVNPEGKITTAYPLIGE